jgi:hypothetical protein
LDAISTYDSSGGDCGAHSNGFLGTGQRTIRTEELLLVPEQEHRISDHNSAPSKVVIERARLSFVVRAPAKL